VLEKREKGEGKVIKVTKPCWEGEEEFPVIVDSTIEGGWLVRSKKMKLLK